MSIYHYQDSAKKRVTSQIYYAHITALDQQRNFWMNRKQLGLAENTIFVLHLKHGDTYFQKKRRMKKAAT